MWVQLDIATRGKYHNMSKTMPHKKEIRNSKAATHKTRYNYISEHWSENGAEPDLGREMTIFEDPSSTLRRCLTPK